MSIELLQPFDGCLPERQQIPLDRFRDRRKTILVVDADRALLKTIVYVLRWAGYEIHVAFTSSEAMSICQRFSVTIDLILCDINLSAASGAELAEKVRVHRPNLPMIFMSGHPMVSRNLWEKGFVVLEKPFSFAEMTYVVREILGAAPHVTISSKPVTKSSLQQLHSIFISGADTVRFPKTT